MFLKNIWDIGISNKTAGLVSLTCIKKELAGKIISIIRESIINNILRAKEQSIENWRK